MATVNIGGDSNDSMYRYKMPEMEVRVTGRGNGVKTGIVNILQIAKSLKVQPGYIIQFFGCELGAQKDTKKATVNGIFSQKDLSKLLEKFIYLYVLCPRCELPETKLGLQKGNVTQTCSACGFNGQTRGTNNKMTSYIIKNPPKSRVKKGNSENQAPHQDEPVDYIHSTPDKNIVWDTDTSEKAVLERQKEIGSSKVLSEATSCHVKKSIEEQACEFREWLAEKNRDTDDIIEYVTSRQVMYAFSSNHIIGMVCDGLFDDKILEKFVSQTPVYRKFIINEKCQKVVLGNIEILCGVREKQTMGKYTAHVVKKFYDTELLDEDAILKYFKKKSKCVDIVVSDELRTQKTMIQFLDWLESSELESESSVSESEGSKIESEPPKPDKVYSDSNDDFDIDDI